MFHTGRCRNPWLGIPFIIHGYPINPWPIIFQWIVMTFSKHGDRAYPRQVILFSQPGDRTNLILVIPFSDNGDLKNPSMEMSFSKYGDNINPWMDFFVPSLENGNNILFWIIYDPKLYFLLILSWILQFTFFSSPGYISVPGLEFVLTLTGYFLINQTWGNCIFSKLGFFWKPGNIQAKTK